jgi:phage baseplate assembly protein W
MSSEIQVGFPCPHMVLEEPVAIGSDRRSMVTRAPIANSNTVRVLVNNAIYVPPAGLFSQATLISGVGPYRVERCVGVRGSGENLLTVHASQGTRIVPLPLGARVRVEDMVRTLRLALSGLVQVDVKDGAVALTDTFVNGSESYVRVSGRGATVLGFTQLGSRGQQVYPGWRLVAYQDVSPTLGTSTPARYPQFVSPLQGDPEIKVTYTAVPNRCPRCVGTYVENDYRFDLQGRVITLKDEDLLYQTCLKALLTIKGSNPYHPGYGSTLSSRIGSKQVRAAAAALREDVVACLNQVQVLQEGQRQFQQVTDRERLYRVNSVDVRPAQDDPTVFYVDVTVTNGSGVPVSLNIVYSAPGSIALAGTNGQSLGTFPAGV